MFAAGVAITVAGTMVGGGAVSAHHPLIEATNSCQGTVSFTASAWTPPDSSDPAHRTNPQIDISYQVEGYQPSVFVTSGAFNAGNSYSFSGQFTYPAGAANILVRATAVGTWGNGSAGGDSWSVWVYPRTDCNGTTTTVAETTTTVAETTTTVAETTTTEAATTTTEVDSGGPTTTTTVLATTTTEVDSGGPTTTVLGTTTTEVASGGPTTTLVGGDLPRTGSDPSGSLLMIATGLMLMGGSFVMTVRRRPA